MRTTYIPRTAYEVYFIPIEKKRPNNTTIAQYLREYHPFYSRSSMINRSACVIHEKRFEMITVFRHPYRLMIHKLTQTAIFVKSSLGKKNCVILAPGELLYFDSEPRSFPISDETQIPVHPDHIFSTKTEIEQLAKQEGLVNNRLAFIISIAFFVFLALAFATVTHKNSKPELHVTSAIETSIPTSVPGIYTSGFAECFSADIKAINAAKSTVRSYRFESGSTESVFLLLKGGSATSFTESLAKAKGVINITIPDISFTGEKPEYTVCYGRNNGRINQKKAVAFSVIRNLEDLCARETYLLEKIRLTPSAECTFCATEEKLPSLIVAFVSFCAKESLDIQSLSIDSPSSSNGTYTIKTAFCPASSGIPQLSIDKGAIKSAFMNHQKNIAAKVTIENAAFVGRISEKGTNQITYKKSTDGKFICERRIP